MSHGTHGPKETKRDKYNDLLTSFGEEIKNWARGNKKDPSQMTESNFLFPNPM